jgi:hypothetical protein
MSPLWLTQSGLTTTWGHQRLLWCDRSCRGQESSLASARGSGKANVRWARLPAMNPQRYAFHSRVAFSGLTAGSRIWPRRRTTAYVGSCLGRGFANGDWFGRIDVAVA